MYFDNVEKVFMDQLFCGDKEIYAHVLNDKKETLREHAELVLRYLYKIVEVKGLNSVLKNLEDKLTKSLSLEGQKLYREMLVNTIYMHDIGKINCNFQHSRMDNKAFSEEAGLQFNNANHSMLSSLIYLNEYFEKIQGHTYKEDRNKLLIFMMINAYIISKHHGGLDSFNEFKNKLLEEDGEGYRLYTEELSMFDKIYKNPIIFGNKKDLLKRVFNNMENSLSDMEKKEEGGAITLYIYTRFITSLLLSCDYYATSHFKNQKEIKEFGTIKDIHKIYETFKTTKINKGIGEYKKKFYGTKQDFANIRDINILRNELFIEAEENLLHSISENIFYLEAPTGSGKSNVAFNLSFKIAEKLPHHNKIFYVYPFNTLIEQNVDTLKKVFGQSDVINDIAVINSVVPIKIKEDKLSEKSEVLEKNYEISLLDRQFLHYPIILTTHVSIFNYLFGTSKDNLFPLYQIANSVVILDEIQSYKNSIWKEIITFLKHYSEVLNIKFIIMSATLPNLNKLIEGEKGTINLIANRDKYFTNPIFRNRVALDFSLLEIKENIMESLLAHVIKTSKKIDGNILIEFIKKKTAMDFYKELKKYYNSFTEGEQRNVELITGDDNSIDRQTIIEKINNNKNIILVATQVIEAGVDIDMDIGYKDISMLDAEEQFLGRVNRSCRKYGSKVYFFDLDDPSRIYRNDIRKEKNISLREKEIREILINKNFGLFYDYVLKELNKASKKLNDKNFKDFICRNVMGLNFKNVEEKMALIDERYEYSVFLNRTIALEENENLKGHEVWEEYIQLLQDNSMGYAEKRIKLSKTRAKLNYFIYKVQNSDFTYNERIGDLYYIDDGDKYFMDEKFDRENFNKGIGDFI